MNTYLTIDSANLIQNSSPKKEAKQPESKNEEQQDVQASIYDGAANFPNNYYSKINYAQKADEEEDEELIAELQGLIADVSKIAEAKGRQRLLKSVIGKDGLPIRGFDINAVIQLGANPHYTNSFLERLIKKTKKQNGAMFSENFSEDSKVQLFGIEEHKVLGENNFKIRTETFNPTGKLQASCDKYTRDVVYSKYNGVKSRTITKYKEDDPRKIQRSLDYKISIEYDKNGKIKNARYLTPSDELQGAFREYEYDLEGKDFNNPKDILDSVQNDGIKPSKVISDTMRNENGDITYIQNYKTNGYSISRKFISSKNGSSEQNYTITNSNGEKIFETNRKFEILDENNAISTIDGKKYEIKYDNKNRQITLKNEGNERIIDIDDRISNMRNFYQGILLRSDDEYNEIIESGIYERDDCINTEDDKKILWAQAKMLPADLLIEFDDNVAFWTLDDNEDSYFVEGMLGTEYNAKRGVLAHELGHGVENRLKMKYDDGIINTFYQEEIEFIKNHSGEEANAMIYFFNNECDKGTEIETGGGIDEVIAEVNCLLNSQGIETENISLRSKFLVENFPRTVAKIGSKFMNYEQEKAPELS